MQSTMVETGYLTKGLAQRKTIKTDLYGLQQSVRQRSASLSKSSSGSRNLRETFQKPHIFHSLAHGSDVEQDGNITSQSN